MNTQYRIPTFIIGSAALLLAACNSPSAPETRGVDAKVVTADIRYIASRVTAFGLKVGPGESREPKQKAIAKTSDFAGDCSSGIEIDSGIYLDDERGRVTYLDSTWHYDGSGTLGCPLDFTDGWDVQISRESDSIMETRMWRRFELAPGGARVAGNGTIHYLSGFDMTLDTMEVLMGLDGSPRSFRLDLGLFDGRYRVPLGIAEGVDFLNEETWLPDQVILQGPIVQGPKTVGYFEIVADDRVIIRDASRNIVTNH